MAITKDQREFKERVLVALSRFAGSDAELARQCGVSRAAAGKWRRGQVTRLQPDSLFAIAKACQVNAEWLQYGRGPMIGVDPTSAIATVYNQPISAAAAHAGREWDRLHEPVKSLIFSLVQVLATEQQGKPRPSKHELVTPHEPAGDKREKNTSN